MPNIQLIFSELFLHLSSVHIPLLVIDLSPSISSDLFIQRCFFPPVLATIFCYSLCRRSIETGDTKVVHGILFNRYGRDDCFRAFESIISLSIAKTSTSKTARNDDFITTPETGQPTLSGAWINIFLFLPLTQL
jgi:hypothetical protein